MRTCRQLHTEAAHFLYSSTNNYLFHILGPRAACVATYGALERTLRTYAAAAADDATGAAEVHVHALTNGPHSQTGAILLHVGDASLASVGARGRGVPMSVEEMRREGEEEVVVGHYHHYMDYMYGGLQVVGLVAAVVVAILAALVAAGWAVE
jgi:hypothetical protein